MGRVKLPGVGTIGGVTHRPTAVICDDRPELVHLAEMWLEGAGVDPVGTAANAVDVGPLCRRLAPDLVIIDEELDGESGIEAVPELRRTVPEAMIVVWTIDPDVGPAALDAGADAYLAKDDFEGLDRVVAMVTARGHAC